MPEGSNPVKVAAVRALGATVVSDGVTAANREERVLALQERTGLALIHPFDAWDTIHGQGTIGLELLEDVPDLGLLIAPVGGGGLVSGCALAVKAARPEVRVVGVEPELAADAAASRRSGRHERLATASATIADGLRSMSVGKRGFEVIVGARPGGRRGDGERGRDRARDGRRLDPASPGGRALRGGGPGGAARRADRSRAGENADRRRPVRG